MNGFVQTVTTATISIGPPAVILVVNPYLVTFVFSVVLITCSLVCFSIIANCRKRNKRLDAIMTRATRRAYAKSCGGRC